MLFTSVFFSTRGSGDRSVSATSLPSVYSCTVNYFDLYRMLLYKAPLGSQTEPSIKTKNIKTKEEKETKQLEIYFYSCFKNQK